MEGYGKKEAELVDYIKEIIEEAEVPLDSQKISIINKFGTQTSTNLPMAMTLSTIWKKQSTSHLLISVNIEKLRVTILARGIIDRARLGHIETKRRRQMKPT